MIMYSDDREAPPRAPWRNPLPVVPGVHAIIISISIMILIVITLNYDLLLLIIIITTARERLVPGTGRRDERRARHHTCCTRDTPRAVPTSSCRT